MIAAILLAAAVQCHVGVDSKGVVYPDGSEHCTPGDTRDVTREQVCAKGFSRASRNVTDTMKGQVFAAYGIAAHRAGEYEIDHRISVCAGGASTLLNLWPQRANPVPGFHQKDLVEAWACREMCRGTLTLQEAQEADESWYAHLVQKNGKWKAVR